MTKKGHLKFCLPLKELKCGPCL